MSILMPFTNGNRLQVPAPLSPPIPHAAAAPAIGDGLLDEMLVRLGCGYLVLDGARKIVMANEAAEDILACALGAEESGSRDRALRELMQRAGARVSPGGMCWIAMSEKVGAYWSQCQFAGAAPAKTSIVLTLDLDAHPEPKPETLRQMFNLSEAEAHLALELARGRTPAEVAVQRQVSRTTVRSQLGAVFGKTNTRRQADLVVLLARVAMLP